MMARVRMYHAGSDRYQDASQEAFETVWSADGWVLAHSDEDPAVVPDGPVADPEPVAKVEDPAADTPARNGKTRR